jgi:hypothetical protein
MDIASLCTKEQSEEGSWMEIMGLDYVTPIGAQILVLGPDSSEVVKMADTEQRRALKILSDLQTKKNSKALDEEEPSDVSAVRRACLLTKNWRSIELGGKQYEYSKDNATWLYTNSPHIRDQVLRYYQERANFIKPGSKNSQKRSGGNSSSNTPEEKTE